MLTYLLLMRAFRSLLLPLKAVLLNLLSVGASYGMLVLVFRWGVGARADRARTSDAAGRGLDPDLPVRDALRPLDGLRGVPRHTDARGVGRGADNATAVAHGLERTGRIVTAAAVIMCAAFSGFVAGRIVGLQQFGVGLAVAIFVDATIVRSLLVPSLMALFGRWNWWLPGARGPPRASPSARRQMIGMCRSSVRAGPAGRFSSTRRLDDPRCGDCCARASLRQAR